MSQIKKVKEFTFSEKEANYKMWSDMGVFEGVEFNESVILSGKLMELANILASNFEPIRGKSDSEMIFAIVIRAYRKHNYLIQSCLEVLFHIKRREGAIEKSPGIDIEAEFCALMAQEISDLKL